MRRVLCFDGFDGHDRWWTSLIRYLRQRGMDVDLLKKCYSGDLKSYDQVVVWNGEPRRAKEMAQRAINAGIPVCFIEVGFFGQKSHFMLSQNGSVGGSLLSDVDQLDPITKDEEQRLQKFFHEYALGRVPTDGDIVLAPLQLETDYAIRHYSPFQSMQLFADAVGQMRPDSKIVYRPHPRHRKQSINTPHKVRLTSSIWDQVLSASEVIGINSTLLYEAALAGKPVTALGACPLRRFPDQHREIVREIIDRQIPVDWKDLQDVSNRVRLSIGRDLCSLPLSAVT